MKNLKRTKQGNFDIKDCYTIEEVKNNKYKLITKEEALKDLYTVEVDEYLEKKIRNGCILDNIYNKDLILFKKDGKIIASYKSYLKEEGKIKPDKMF